MKRTTVPECGCVWREPSDVLYEVDGMDNMDVKWVRIDDLKPYAKNPRKNDGSIEYVANSIKEFGWRQPIVADKDGVIIAGHTRYKAAKRLRRKTVPVVYADDLTDDQVKAYRLADNKTAEASTWDSDLLLDELDGIFDIDMGAFGFDFSADEIEVQEDDFAPEPPKEPKSKQGCVYQLGRHRLMCGDSTNEDDVERLMDGEKADMIFTDPPYGMNLDTDYSSMKGGIFKNGAGGNKYEQGMVDDFHPEMILAIFSVGAKEIFLWGADYYAELLPEKNNGSWIVWDKRANGNDDLEEDYSSDKMYGSCFELCWSKKKHKRDIARVKWAGVFGVEQEFDHKRHHPTQKPVKLAEWFLKRYSKENDAVVDLFGGSGSTLMACEQLGRTCYMMELDPKYVDVIIDRWEQFTGQKAVLLQ